MKNMKRFFMLIVPVMVIVVSLTSAAIQQAVTCDQKALKDAAREKLEPYKYDSGKVTQLRYKNKPQVKEIEVPVFIGEKYRMVFNTTALTKDVVINVYNKDKETKNRKAIWSSKSSAPGTKLHVFEPDNAKFKFFVDYDLPAVTDSTTAEQECVVFMLGYK
jgi:hypothetical protein